MQLRRSLLSMAVGLTTLAACSSDVVGSAGLPAPNAARVPGGGSAITVADLGVLPTSRAQSPYAVGMALNTATSRSAVQVVGSSSSGCCVREGPMSWTAQGGMTALATLPGFTTGWAKGVSATGYVVGELSGSSGSRAFVVAPGGGGGGGSMAALPLLDGAQAATADAISGGGTFIVGSNTVVGPDGARTGYAVVWRGLGASVEALGTGSAYGISEDSVVAGTAALGGVSVAAVWAKGASQWTLTALASTPSEARDINPAGTLVAGRLGSAPAVWRRTADGGWALTILPRLVADDPASFALSADNAGRVVGVSNNRGVLWTPGSGGGYTVQALPGLASGGTGSWAAAINEAGQIAGRATASAKQGGGWHAVLWTLP